MPYSLLYVSSATHPFSASDLATLLQRARERNTSADITGMLLYKDGNFMQLLEGDEQAVNELYRRIATDPRHGGAITLLKGLVTERSFADWSMGFRDLTAGSADIPGYSSFMNTALTSDEFVSQPSAARKLLLMFRSRM